MIFNQFDEFGNYLWHYSVTGPAFADLAEELMGPGDRLAGVALTTGSSGTLASGDYVKERFPGSRIAAGEALQCPTMLQGGFGEHGIEGSADSTFRIHNVRKPGAVGLPSIMAPLGYPALNERPGRTIWPPGSLLDVIERLDCGAFPGRPICCRHQDGQVVTSWAGGYLVFTVLTIHDHLPKFAGGVAKTMSVEPR